MTDKEQIIIDGVNVSGCNNFSKKDKISCYHPLYDKCYEVPNCSFKQLARKTQEFEQLQEKYEALKLENEEGYEIVDELKHECEELKEKLRELELKNTTLQNRNQQLDGSMTECEELKERIKCNCFDPKSNNNRCISYNRIAEDYKRDLKRLENKIAECEELKEEIEALEKINRRNDQELLRRLTYASNAEKQRDRYLETLEEIKELIVPVANKNPVYNCWELLNKCDGCGSKKDCGAQSPYYVAKQILNIINKIKEQ